MFAVTPHDDLGGCSCVWGVETAVGPRLMGSPEAGCSGEQYGDVSDMAIDVLVKKA